MGESPTSASNGQAGQFPNTRWSMWHEAVHLDGEQASTALEQICTAYWYPLYAFARRKGQSPEDASDLTQSFFKNLLEKNWLADADQQRGKLRTFLLTSFQRFMAREWRREQTQRRGGETTTISLELCNAEDRYLEASIAPSAEELFDRQWALTLMQQTLTDLERHLKEQDRPQHFAILQPTLMAERGELDYPKLAEQLQTTPQAARVAVHRFRKRFRESFRTHVTQTLSEEDNLEEELNKLAQALL